MFWCFGNLVICQSKYQTNDMILREVLNVGFSSNTLNVNSLWAKPLNYMTTLISIDWNIVIPWMEWNSVITALTYVYFFHWRQR